MKLEKRVLFLLLIIILTAYKSLYSDPMYLNYANPWPLFSSQGRYNHVDSISKDEVKNFILEGKETTTFCKGKRFHANIMPYIQQASTGANYRGEETLTSYINTNVTQLPINEVNTLEENILDGGSSQSSPSQNTTANLVKTQPMPLGAIPEPFNYFALFYPNNPSSSYESQVYKTGKLMQLEYDATEENSEITPEDFIEAQTDFPLPLGKDASNQVAKIVARYLGMADAPFIVAEGSSGEQERTNSGDLGTVVPSPLMYDYSNYSNHFFGLMQYPPSRDPKRLFGYGYFDAQYQKIGVRGTFEWNFDNDFELKIYTGFSSLEISNIKVVDTTMNYQGPTGAIMFSRYPDPMYTLSYNNDTEPVDPFLPVNIYQLTNYTNPIIDSSSNAVFNSNYHSNSELRNYLPDQFKTSFLQNIQYNTDSLGELTDQSFRPYSQHSIDDTTIELRYQKLFIYNKPQGSYNDKDCLEHHPYLLSPTCALHVTCPIAPQAPKNKAFSQPLDNNGHWELGGNFGLEFDFIKNIVFGTDVGLSWYSESFYNNYPVPTNQFNQGIYLYNANLTRNPGFSYTAAIGMQVDELYHCLDFFAEWRMVKHAQDTFQLHKINNLLPIEYMQDTHQSPDDEGALSTIPNGVLYLNYGETPPYPETAVLSHLEAVSSWTVNLINVTSNFKISENTNIGIAWQQPFWIRNALNAATFGISFEMYM
jgi:hypothetical protein